MKNFSTVRHKLSKGRSVGGVSSQRPPVIVVIESVTIESVVKESVVIKFIGAGYQPRERSIKQEVTPIIV